MALCRIRHARIVIGTTSVLAASMCGMAFGQDRPTASCSTLDTTDARSVANCMLTFRDQKSSWVWIDYARPLSCKDMMDDFARMISVSPIHPEFKERIDRNKSRSSFPSCSTMSKAWSLMSQKNLYWSSCVDDDHLYSPEHIARCISSARQSYSRISNNMSCADSNHIYLDLINTAGAIKYKNNEFFHETNIYKRIMGSNWNPSVSLSGNNSKQIQDRIDSLIAELRDNPSLSGEARRSIRRELSTLQSSQRAESRSSPYHGEQGRQYARDLPALFGQPNDRAVDCDTMAVALETVFKTKPTWSGCTSANKNDLTSISKSCLPKPTLLGIRNCDDARIALKRSALESLGADTANSIGTYTCDQFSSVIAMAEDARKQEAAEAAKRRTEVQAAEIAEKKRKEEERSRPTPACEPFHSELVKLDKEVERIYLQSFGSNKLNEALGPVVALQMMAVCPVMDAKYPMYFYDLCIDKLSTDSNGNNRPGWIGSSPVPAETKKQMQNLFTRAAAGGCFAR